jgi:hypothetical protein
MLFRVPESLINIARIQKISKRGLSCARSLAELPCLWRIGSLEVANATLFFRY